MNSSQGQNTQNNLRNRSKRPWEWQPRSRQRYVLIRMPTLPAHFMVPEMPAPMLSNKGVMAAGPLDVLELLQLSSCPQVPKSQGHLESERLERQMHVSKGSRTTFRIQAVQKSVTVVTAPNQTASSQCSEFHRCPSVRTGVPACLCSASGTCSSHSIYCTTKDIDSHT